MATLNTYWSSCSTLSSVNRSVITLNPGGRIGNQLFSYVVLSSLRHEHPGLLSPFLDHESHQTLSKLFSNISLPSANDLCNFPGPKWPSMSVQASYDEWKTSLIGGFSRVLDLWPLGWWLDQSGTRPILDKHFEKIKQELQENGD